MSIGRGLGSLLYLVLVPRRKVTLANLAIAFPEKSESERHALGRHAFIHLGMATAETAWIWYRQVDELEGIEFHGTEHVDVALARGKGVILLQAHFTVLELCAAVVGRRWPVSAVYDPPKNPLFSEYLLWQRSRHLSDLIDNRAIRSMVRKLRHGEMVWFSPDQTVAAEHGGVTTEYFGQPALSSSGTARIVSMTQAVVIPFIPTRLENGRGYRFSFEAPLTLDTDDIEQATQDVNDHLESIVRRQPEQYLWAHKRFKPPTPDHPNPSA